jgi:hypothetical protein
LQQRRQAGAHAIDIEGRDSHGDHYARKTVLKKVSFVTVRKNLQKNHVLRFGSTQHRKDDEIDSVYLMACHSLLPHKHRFGKSGISN